MGKKEQDLREMLHKYRKQARELLEVIAESKRKDAERLDAQKKAEGIARVNQRAFYDGTSVPSSRQGKSAARAHVRFGMTLPGDVAQTNIPQLVVKRVSFPKD